MHPIQKQSLRPRRINVFSYDRNDPSDAVEISQTATTEMNDNNCMSV